MNCKNIQKNLIPFMEQELPEEQRIQIEDHIKGCPACIHLLEEFSQLWGTMNQKERIQPSPYFWLKLNRRISGYEKERKPFLEWCEGMVRRTRSALAVTAVLVCIFLGYSLGNFPQTVNGQTQSSEGGQTTALQQFFEYHYMSPLNDLAKGSIEATYWDMVSEE